MEYRKTLSGSYELSIVKVLAMVKTHQNRGMVTPLSRALDKSTIPPYTKATPRTQSTTCPSFSAAGPVNTSTTARIGVVNQTKCESPQNLSACSKANGEPVIHHEYTNQATKPS